MTGIITSIPPLVEQPPGNNASNPAGLPGVTYTAAIPVLPQTWTGLQTFNNGSVQFAGSTSGNTFLNATAIASGTLTLPAATDTLVGRNTTDTLTNKTLTSPTITGATLTGASISGATITTSTYNGNIWTAGTGTLTIAAGKTEAFNNSLTFAGSDGTTLTFQGTDTYVGRATTDTLTNKTINGASNTLTVLAGSISGTLLAANFPALTGDVTTSAGSLATAIAANAVTNAKMATMSAWTFKVNNTSGTATPTDITIDGLTVKASPAAADEVIIWDVAGAALKKATVSGIGSSAGVSSLNGQTGALVNYYAPQGRITLTSGTAVPTTSVAAATTVYYTPSIGNLVPIYDGTNMVPTVFPEVSQLTTDTTKSPAAVAANSCYDLFVWNDAGTVRCTRGPAWTNTTTRSAGTALTSVNGINLNSVSITNGPAASRGTYVGTIVSNGTSTIDFIFGASANGGVAANFGIWNAYNRVDFKTSVQDSLSVGPYSSSTPRPAHNSTSNRVTFVSGLPINSISASYEDLIVLPAVNLSIGFIGFVLDATAAFDKKALLQNPGSTGLNATASVSFNYPAQTGQHFIQAMEASDGTNGATFNGGVYQALNVSVYQ